MRQPKPLPWGSVVWEHSCWRLAWARAARAGVPTSGVSPSWAVSNARKHPATGAELAKERETPIVSGPFEEIEKAPKYRLVGLKLPRSSGRFFMAMVQGKECGGQISENADACPHCGDVIKEARPKFSLTDLLHRISVPVILSVAGTMITILSYFSMEGNGKRNRLASSSTTLSTRIRSSSSIASSTLITCSRHGAFRRR